MSKQHTYVKCQACEWQLENFPDRDWNEHPCERCNNTRQVIDPREILCNMCGESMCPIGTHNEQYPHGLYKAQVIGGYDSYHLLDMNRYTFSFCEKCLRLAFMACKIKPEVHDVDFNGGADEYGYEADQTAYEYRLWRDQGGFHQAYLNKKCNAVKDCPNKAAYTIMHNGTKFTENALCEEHKDKRYSNCTLVKFIPNVLKPFL